jgi:hypothetical protein
MSAVSSIVTGGRNRHHSWFKVKLHNYVCEKCGTRKLNVQAAGGGWIAEWHLPDFVDALQALVSDVCSICEFPSSEKPKFSMRVVSLSWSEDGTFGACLTALRVLMTTDTPLIINSPFLPERPRDSDPSGFCLGIGTVRRLRALQEEADRYYCGERAPADRGGRAAAKASTKGKKR